MTSFQKGWILRKGFSLFDFTCPYFPSAILFSGK